MDLPVPALTAASVGRDSVASAAPSSPPSRELAPASLARAASFAPLLALAAAVLGGVAAFTAAPPGLIARLRATALARRSEPVDAHAATASPLERTVARLVPLAVVDDGGADERASSTASRSAVRRILPPT